MHVLVPDDDGVDARVAHARLAAAGHEVHLCHDALDPTDNGYACAAVRTGACPLDDYPIDATVVVRSRGGGGVAPEEDGVLCTIRRHIPLVVAGNIRDNPYRSWTGVEIAGSDVVDAVERLAQLPLARLSEAATAALGRVVESEVPALEHARVQVWRRQGCLEALISTAPPLGHADAVVAAVEVHSALRTVDRWARGVDISISSGN